MVVNLNIELYLGYTVYGKTQTVIVSSTGTASSLVS